MAPHSSAVKLQSRAAPPSAMGAHKWSHAVSKTAPPRKIRIVHVLAPEVIKADVGEFREVVQRLTGKPNGGGDEGSTLYPSSYDTAAEPSQAAGWSPDTVVVPAGGRAMAGGNRAIKAEVKQEVEAVASPVTSGEEGIPEVIDDVFFQQLDDFLSSSSCQMVEGGYWH